MSRRVALHLLSLVRTREFSALDYRTSLVLEDLWPSHFCLRLGSGMGRLC